MPKKQKIPKTMLEFVPFRDVWNNFVYLDDNHIIGGIKIGSINLELLFYEEQKIKVSQLKKVLNSVDYPIKILSYDKPMNLDDNLNMLGAKIKSESNKNKIKILEEDYQYIEFLNKNKWAVNREFYLIVEEESGNENLLKQKLTDLIQELNSIGLLSSLVKSEEWRDLLFETLNPATSVDSFKKDATGITRSFKERISPSGLKISEKSLMVGDAYISVVTLVSYPSSVPTGWLGAVANVNNTRMVISISPMNTTEISRTLKKSISETKSKMINIGD